MRKLNVFSTILLMTMVTAQPLQAATTLRHGCQISGEGCEVTEPPKPNLIALSWGDVFKFFSGVKGSKGRRDPFDLPNSYTCMVVPGIMEDRQESLKGTANTVMTRKPLFLWHGKVTQIELYDADKPKNEPIWTRTLQTGQQSIVYDGKVPLVPNSKGYYWQLTLKYPPKSKLEKKPPELKLEKKPRKAFAILDGETTAAIQKQFDEIEQESISDSEKALKRIEILSQEEYGPTEDEALGADILAELYKLDTLPPKLAALKDMKFCPDPNASAS